MIKRCFDILVSLIGLVFVWPILLVLALIVKLDTTGPSIHWSKRVGKDSALFMMPKYRSMRIDTPQLPTHLLKNSDAWLTRSGKWLRRTSLDELPQLLSVLRGDMSLVGPRPALFSQDDLMTLRREHGVDRLRPGITGWAQINGRDDLPIPEKVAREVEYLKRQSFVFDMKIIALTVMRVFSSQGVSH